MPAWTAIPLSMFFVFMAEMFIELATISFVFYEELINSFMADREKIFCFCISTDLPGTPVFQDFLPDITFNTFCKFNMLFLFSVPILAMRSSRVRFVLSDPTAPPKTNYA